MDSVVIKEEVVGWVEGKKQRQQQEDFVLFILLLSSTRKFYLEFF